MQVIRAQLRSYLSDALANELADSIEQSIDDELNSIEGDTWELVSQRDMGINVSREDLADAARQAAEITPQHQQALGAHTLQAFYDLFTEERFQQILLSHL